MNKECQLPMKGFGFICVKKVCKSHQQRMLAGRELMGNSANQKSADLDQQCLPDAGENLS